MEIWQMIQERYRGYIAMSKDTQGWFIRILRCFSGIFTFFASQTRATRKLA